MTEFTKAEAHSLSMECMALLEAVAESRGLEVKYKGGTYTGGSFKPRFEFRTKDAGRSEWIDGAWEYDLPTDGFGREFSFRGERFKIVGLNRNAPKFPVVLLNVSTGKNVRGSVGMVRAGLDREGE